MVFKDFLCSSRTLGFHDPISMENPPLGATVSHWERLCNFQGNDAVEVGIVPVSEVEENELNESLVGKGPGLSSKDIIRTIWLVKVQNTKNESKICTTYCSIFIYHTIRIYKDGIGFVMF